MCTSLLPPYVEFDRGTDSLGTSYALPRAFIKFFFPTKRRPYTYACPFENISRYIINQHNLYLKKGVYL